MRTYFLKAMLSIWLLWSALGLNSAQAYWVDCPYCGVTSNYYAMPFSYYQMPSFFPNTYPAWAGYGSMAYSNFYYPGAWSYGGINGRFYPGYGGGFAAKPNLYVSGKEGAEVRITVELKGGSNWLAASPVHGTSGWQGKLKGDGSKGESKIEVAGVPYAFLYYDYRFDDKKMQDGAGFCTDRENLIPKMAQGLKAAGFKENEIRDFAEHWSVKIPPSDRYCVYPQDETFLNQVAELKIEPKPKSVKRLLYIVVVGEALSRAKNKFAAMPKSQWNLDGTPSGNRLPAAADDGLEIREWGVGFLSGNRK